MEDGILHEQELVLYPKEEYDSGLSGGTIAGIVIARVVVVAVVVVLVVLAVKGKLGGKKTNKHEESGTYIEVVSA